MQLQHEEGGIFGNLKVFAKNIYWSRKVCSITLFFSKGEAVFKDTVPARFPMLNNYLDLQLIISLMSSIKPTWRK